MRRETYRDAADDAGEEGRAPAGSPHDSAPNRVDEKLPPDAALPLSLALSPELPLCCSPPGSCRSSPPEGGGLTSASARASPTVGESQEEQWIAASPARRQMCGRAERNAGVCIAVAVEAVSAGEEIFATVHRKILCRSIPHRIGSLLEMALY